MSVSVFVNCCGVVKGENKRVRCWAFVWLCFGPHEGILNRLPHGAVFIDPLPQSLRPFDLLRCAVWSGHCISMLRRSTMRQTSSTVDASVSMYPIIRLRANTTVQCLRLNIAPICIVFIEVNRLRNSQVICLAVTISRSLYFDSICATVTPVSAHTSASILSLFMGSPISQVQA